MTATDAFTLKGGRLICPASGLDQVADVRVEGGRIAAIRAGIQAPGPEVDCRGRIVAPALIDLQAQLCDPGLVWREDLRTGSAAAAAGGFTAVLASPLTRPVMADPSLVRELRERIPREASVDVLIAASLTTEPGGTELAEIGLMLDAGAAAISDGGAPATDTIALRHAMLYARPFGAPLLLRAGLPSLEAGGLMHEGEVSARIGLRGIPAASEEIALARIVALVRDTGCAVHVTGVTSALGARAVERAKAEGLPITASTPAHHLLLTDALVDESGYHPHARLLPPLRSSADRDALVAAVRSGAIDAAYSDHAPLTRVDKEMEFGLATPGMTALETALSCALAGLGDVAAAIRALSTAPAALLGLRREIAAGADADLVVFDAESSWTVDPSALRSKCGNTPLADRSLPGVVDLTLRRGEIIYRRTRDEAR